MHKAFHRRQDISERPINVCKILTFFSNQGKESKNLKRQLAKVKKYVSNLERTENNGNKYTANGSVKS